MQPLFTLSFVEHGAALAFRCLRRHWSPAALTLDFALGPLRAREVRSAPGGALASEWEIKNPTRRAVTLDVVCWTAVDGATLAAGDVRVARGKPLHFTRELLDRKGHRTRIVARLFLTPAAQSYAGYRSEAATPALPPQFDLTPFADRWMTNGRLSNELHLDGIDPKGLVFLGLQRRFRVPARGAARLSAAITLGQEQQGATAERRYGGGFAAQALQQWESFFSSVPSFRCSDRYLDRYWWYRWYGLKLNAIAGGVGNYPHPTVCEGIGSFHVPITYSAQCHIRELRWLSDPAWAQGVLRTFLAHQKPDGSFHGRIYVDHLTGTDFYHADWGGALDALLAVHPDPAFAAEVYPGLARYGGWLLRARDADNSGMIDVVDQYETGQEYMSRYQAVDPDADRYGWENRIRLKGVDVTVYAYRLFRVLEQLAAGASPVDVGRWREAAERAARAILEAMWDPAVEMFFDVNPASSRRTGVKAAVCFYPYMTGLTGERHHLHGLERHLFNPKEFWTPYPVPSSSVDDPLFNPDALWKGKRHNCPWNGRVWPMTNSHIADALAHVVRAQRPAWAPRLGLLLRQFVRMMTFDGRADRPNCFEHYHPFTGRPSLYRGIDDYQHSWVNDLIVSHVMGVLPQGKESLVVHPLPLGIAAATLDSVRVAGHRVRVAIAGRRFRVGVDGRRAGEGRVGEPLAIEL